MMRLFLNLLRPGQCNCLRVSIPRYLLRSLFWNVTDSSPGFRNSGFYVEPLLELALLVKDPSHLGTPVSPSSDRKDGQPKSTKHGRVLILNSYEHSNSLDRNS